MNKKFFLTIILLSIIGILLAIYLLWEQTFRTPFQPCNINALINCNAIITGSVAKTLGISTPLYGLIGYIAMVFAAMFHKRKLLLGVATFGLLFCLWIGYQELFQLHVICPVCILYQLIMISIFSISLLINYQLKK